MTEIVNSVIQEQQHSAAGPKFCLMVEIPPYLNYWISYQYILLEIIANTNKLHIH